MGYSSMVPCFPNHGIVTREDIGTSASNAVQCQTTVADCCTDSDTNTGDWFFPSGGMVSTTTSSSYLPGEGTRLCGPAEKQWRGRGDLPL